MNTYDIAIIGLGPAGSTLARLLNTKFKVAAIDKKAASGGWGKPCGGLLAHDAQKALASFGLTLPKEVLVDPQIFAVRTLDLGSGLTRHYQRFYLNLDRHKFDMWLRSLVPTSVNIFEDSVCQSIECTDGGFKIKFKTGVEEKEIFAKHIVGADGADSVVRRTFYPNFKVRKYTSIQQWFKEEHSTPFYSCVFDAHNTDCYSWSISKDGYFIFGGAYPAENSRARFDAQKESLAAHGFKFGEVVKTEACQVLRPAGWGQFCFGGENVFLAGEAAGFISPSSLEGISSAVLSAVKLAKVFNFGKKDKNRAYSLAVLPLRIKIFLKLLKCPFMYTPWLRKLVMKTGINSIKIIK
ncbi:flavin-dependent dehydrogenase [Elusimicrobium simillimum]|uniref:FAD-binding protein n=1 Tax=Elusimicrobium simillimum TaxID=3143438 RepID=UPI003C6F6DCD